MAVSSGVSLLLSVCLFSNTLANTLTPKYEWTNLEFDYATEEARQNAIDSGEFNIQAASLMDIDVYYNDNNEQRIFITNPRFAKGIAATLGTITNRTYNGNNVIAPYPTWSWHQNVTSCPVDRIVSVLRIKIDECGRLWVADSGSIGMKIKCPPQILAFDLKTDKLIHRYEIPESQMQPHSLFGSIMVDVRDPEETCSDTFVYIGDSKAFALIVYDVKNEVSWKIADKTFYPYPNFGTFRIGEHHFELMDGIVGMTLSPNKKGADRVFYYHAQSSGTENWVRTSYLRNRTLFANNPSPVPEIFSVYEGQRDTQCPPIATDKDGIAYFTPTSHQALYCWNTATDYKQANMHLLYRNRATIYHTSGVKVILNKERNQELWLSNTYIKKIATGFLDINEINFRIFTATIEELSGVDKCKNDV